MNNITTNTGAVEYNINGVCPICFNPTDSDFIKRLFAVYEDLDKKQDAYKAEIEKMADKRKIFDIAAKRDKEMREMIDDLFGAPVCEAVFGRMNVYALADGLPVWCNLIFAIMDEVDSSFAREQKATNPRIQKHMEKYNKK